MLRHFDHRPAGRDAAGRRRDNPETASGASVGRDRATPAGIGMAHAPRDRLSSPSLTGSEALLRFSVVRRCRSIIASEPRPR